MLFAEEVTQQHPLLHVCTDVGELERWERILQWCARRRRFAFDTETSGFYWFRESRTIGYVAGYDLDDGVGPRGVYFPIRHFTTDKQLPAEAVIAMFGRILGDPLNHVIGHNLPFDIHFAETDGIVVRATPHDTQVMSNLVDERVGRDLEGLIDHYALDPQPYYWKERTKEVHRLVCKRRDIKVSEAPGYALIPVGVLGPYGANDGRFTLLLAQRLLPFVDVHWAEQYELERALMPVLIKAERRGMLVDVDGIHRLHAKCVSEIDTLRTEIQRLARYDLNPRNDDDVSELIYSRLGNPVRFTTESVSYGEDGVEYRRPSVDAVALRDVVHRTGSPLVKLLLDFREVDKIRSTYTTPLLEFVDDRGYLHGRLDQTGTKTGRLACVSGRMVLPTSRGAFSMESYAPQDGDTVWTHMGRRRQVVRKIYKGLDKMYRVRFANGSVLECTAEHRILTAAGWRPLSSLSVGSRVLHVDLEGVGIGSEQHQAHDGGVPLEGEADVREARGDDGDNAPECSVRGAAESREGSVRVREGAPLLAIEDGKQEPYAGQEWFAPSQLHRRHRGRAWVPPEEGGGGVRVRASLGDGGGVGPLGDPRDVRGPPHRRGSEEQRSGQSGARDPGCAPWSACEDTEIREITPLGEMGVWDIEVEGDHSYAAWGVFNHNSKDPNLQNFPSDKSAGVRDLFLVPQGLISVFMDFSQVELRVLAYLSREPTLWAAFINGEDVHAATSVRMFGKATSDNRRVAKVINFGVAYGMSKYGVRDNLNKNADPERGIPTIEDDQAEAYLAQWHSLFPRVSQWSDELCSAMMHTNPPSYTNMFGRTRRISELRSPERHIKRRGKRMAVASMVQGTAAILAKIALVRTDALCEWGRERGYFDAHVITNVHDDIRTDVNRDGAPYFATLAKAEMERWPEFAPIPITVDGEWSSTTWAAKTKIWPKEK